jgi:uncharacterized iron-regulated protein
VVVKVWRVVAVVASGAFATAAAADPTALAAFVEKARDADVVVLGEIHDNQEHHSNQATIVAALEPAALVFEMIPQAREAEFNALREAGADRAALAEALDWDASGWPDFAGYAEIMEAAPRAQVFGAGQAPEAVRLAVAEGAAEAFGPDAAIYGLDRPLDQADQASREAGLLAAHCGEMPVDALPGMVEAQRFRDAGLADATLWARIMTGDGQVVVIAGSAHADKTGGAPAMIALADPEARVVALGQFETGAAPGDETEGAFDAVLLAPPPTDRGDPCAALRAPEE